MDSRLALARTRLFRLASFNSILWIRCGLCLSLAGWLARRPFNSILWIHKLLERSWHVVAYRPLSIPFYGFPDASLSYPSELAAFNSILWIQDHTAIYSLPTLPTLTFNSILWIPALSHSIAACWRDTFQFHFMDSASY